MSYGHGSARRLRFIVDQLQGYVALNIKQPRKPLARAAALKSLPPALKLSFLRGDALLTTRFFSWCEEIGFGLTAPDQALSLHEKLIGNRGKIADLVNRIGLFRAIATQATLPQMDAELAYKIYCGLLDDLHQTEHFRLFELATARFFEFSFRGLFPHRSATEKTGTDLSALRQRAESKLRKAFNQPFEFKESFTAENDQVSFHLRIKLKNRWHHLPSHQGSRLKPTRLAAYEALIQLATSGELENLLGQTPPYPLDCHARRPGE